MTMANTFAAKASVAFVAIAMALMMIAPAQAQTAEELQAQIDTLMATIASLQGQVGTQASADAYVFTRPLTIGSQGADVTALQNYLIGAGFSIPAGATGYFGAQTAAAVAAWQTANGVTPAAGYFGPVSQAKYNALMAAMPSDDDSDDDSSDDDSSDDDSSSTDLSGEASLDNVESSDGDDTDIEEGQEAAPVAEFEVEFTDGDAKITRVDLSFDATGEEDPWDTFEEISLWVDGDEVASMAADDEDEYLDEDDGSLRFSGLDIIAMEDEAVTITVGVTVQGSVDDLPATWNVDMDAIRFVDADDVTSTEDVSVDAVDFDIDVEGADDELAVKAAASDPDDSTLQVEEDGNSDWLTVFAFDLDSDDSSNDIELNDIVIDVASTEDGSTATTSALLINDAKLIIDGEEFDVETITHGTTANLLFEVDGDYAIEAGDRVTAELQIEFKDLASSLEGASVQASVDGSDIEAEGADDITVTGSSTGGEHTLRSSGVVIEGGETTTDTQGTNDTTGIFTIEFDVTAFEDDLYINDLASQSQTNGVEYRVESSTTTLAATFSGTLSSTADDDTGAFFIAEGETETFTLTVTVDPAQAGQYRVILEEVWFSTNSNGTTNAEMQVPTPESDFRTDFENINQ